MTPLYISDGNSCSAAAAAAIAAIVAATAAIFAADAGVCGSIIKCSRRLSMPLSRLLAGCSLLNEFAGCRHHKYAEDLVAVKIFELDDCVKARQSSWMLYREVVGDATNWAPGCCLH